MYRNYTYDQFKVLINMVDIQRCILAIHVFDYEQRINEIISVRMVNSMIYGMEKYENDYCIIIAGADLTEPITASIFVNLL